MMHFVHYHVIVIILRQLKIIYTIAQCVLAREHMLIADRLIVSVPHATEVRVIKHNAECMHRLHQYLLSMGNKEEMTIGMCLTIALEVKCSYDCFTRTRCSNYQITIMSMDVAFYIKLLQNLLLIILRTHQVECREIKQRCFPISTQSFL